METFSYSDLLIFLFGVDLGGFLYGCDRRHPDLSTPDFSDFISSTDEIARAARFCATEGLSRPLALISSSCPKAHGILPSMVRALRNPIRTEARLRKSVVDIRLASILKEADRVGSDLPSSFSQFKEMKEGTECKTKDWAGMADRLQSLGCELLASLARESASSLRPDSTGFLKLGILKAAAILCKTTGVDPDYKSLVLVGPACAFPLPSDAKNAIEASESKAGGFPMFDHHILVCLAESAHIPATLSGGYVILGERDGDSYFLFSH